MESLSSFFPHVLEFIGLVCQHKSLNLKISHDLTNQFET